MAPLIAQRGGIDCHPTQVDLGNIPQRSSIKSSSLLIVVRRGTLFARDLSVSCDNSDEILLKLTHTGLAHKVDVTFRPSSPGHFSTVIRLTTSKQTVEIPFTAHVQAPKTLPEAYTKARRRSVSRVPRRPSGRRSPPLRGMLPNEEFTEADGMALKTSIEQTKVQGLRSDPEGRPKAVFDADNQTWVPAEESKFMDPDEELTLKMDASISIEEDGNGDPRLVIASRQDFGIEEEDFDDSIIEWGSDEDEEETTINMGNGDASFETAKYYEPDPRYWESVKSDCKALTSKAEDQASDVPDADRKAMRWGQLLEQ
ncbi:hypothetical protein J8273_5279 [Carpediemonas membranifera]|uniref:Uncharacterized protein n=1 Tax=Carpediemonas membranifera TaxID=201153 RepID=A0A8J6E8R4_9EUKA|nr:hypothetical protein J8273_5279 [Carpediemonas membranifera]|eukprot:KAG9392290.1 hypothetical protein J8273_5279 [Carpediemonas membranifera]